MGWKQWSAVAVVIGGGILLQIPNHGDMEMGSSPQTHGEMLEGMAIAQGDFRTVALDVTGLT